MTKLSHATARLMLAKQRQMTSLVEKEIIAESVDMEFRKADWVPLYLDRGHKVTSDCATLTAYRAITMKGQLIWMVMTPEKVKGYHAETNDPFEAMEQARLSWAHRRVVRKNWTQVEQTARDLVLGRQKFDIRIEDVMASPLCSLGIDGFRSAIGMGRVTRISGRLAALLMKIEPQMGFVIYAAKQRHDAAQVANLNQGFAELQA